MVAKLLKPRVLVAAVVVLAAAFAIAYFAPYSVAGFYITSLAFGTYVVVRLMTGRRGMRRYRQPVGASLAA